MKLNKKNIIYLVLGLLFLISLIGNFIFFYSLKSKSNKMNINSQSISSVTFENKQECQKYKESIEQDYQAGIEIYYSPKINSCVYNVVQFVGNCVVYNISDALTNESLFDYTKCLGDDSNQENVKEYYYLVDFYKGIN